MFALNAVHRNLYLELKEYEELGVLFVLDGHNASPLQIVEALLIKETGIYMREYETNSEGGLKALTFHKVPKRNYFF
jgi:hypothetical protein